VIFSTTYFEIQKFWSQTFIYTVPLSVQIFQFPLAPFVVRSLQEW